MQVKNTANNQDEIEGEGGGASGSATIWYHLNQLYLTRFSLLTSGEKRRKLEGIMTELKKKETDFSLGPGERKATTKVSKSSLTDQAISGAHGLRRSSNLIAILRVWSGLSEYRTSHDTWDYGLEFMVRFEVEPCMVHKPIL